VTALVLGGTRLVYGIKSYHTDVWQYANNVRHFFVGGSFHFILTDGVWSAGSGLFTVWLMFAIMRLCRHVPFALGFLGALLGISFLISSWSETRIFFPAYAVVLISLSAGLTTRSASPLPRTV
jgi:hypothetical protein